MVFNLREVDYAHYEYQGNDLEELSKSVGNHTPFPDPRAGMGACGPRGTGQQTYLYRQQCAVAWLL